MFETLAFIIGYQYYLYCKKTSDDPISDSNRVWIFIGAAAGAFLFSRIIGTLENPKAFINTAHPFLYFFSSKTIVGGLLGGLVGVEIIKKIIGEKQSSGDLITFPIIAGMIIGRIGCFLNGIAEPTFGIETTAWFGLDLGDGIKRHPLALYEIFFLGVLWLLLSLTTSRGRWISGIRFQMFMIAYLLFRFSVDFIKPRIHIAAGLSTIQLCCLAGLFYYGKTIIMLIFKPSLLSKNGK